MLCHMTLAIYVQKTKKNRKMLTKASEMIFLMKKKIKIKWMSHEERTSMTKNNHYRNQDPMAMNLVFIEKQNKTRRREEKKMERQSRKKVILISHITKIPRNRISVQLM